MRCKSDFCINFCTITKNENSFCTNCCTTTKNESRHERPEPPGSAYASPSPANPDQARLAAGPRGPRPGQARIHWGWTVVGGEGRRGWVGVNRADTVSADSAGASACAIKVPLDPLGHIGILHHGSYSRSRATLFGSRGGLGVPRLWVQLVVDKGGSGTGWGTGGQAYPRCMKCSWLLLALWKESGLSRGCWSGPRG